MAAGFPLAISIVSKKKASKDSKEKVTKPKMDHWGMFQDAFNDCQMYLEKGDRTAAARAMKHAIEVCVRKYEEDEG